MEQRFRQRALAWTDFNDGKGRGRDFSTSRFRDAPQDRGADQKMLPETSAQLALALHVHPAGLKP